MKTSQIEKALEESDKFDDDLIKSNLRPELSDMLKGYIERRGISRAELIKQMDVNSSYGYQLLNGTRAPSRDLLIKIGLILELDIDELQHTLAAAGEKALYVKDYTDARVFYAIKHNMQYESAAAFIWGEA